MRLRCDSAANQKASSENRKACSGNWKVFSEESEGFFRRALGSYTHKFPKRGAASLTYLPRSRLDLLGSRLGLLRLRLSRNSDPATEGFLNRGINFKDAYRSTAYPWYSLFTALQSTVPCKITKRDKTKHRYDYYFHFHVIIIKMSVYSSLYARSLTHALICVSMIPYGIKEVLQSGFWFPLQVMSCMLRPRVYCIYMYFHTCLVFVSEWNTCTVSHCCLVSCFSRWLYNNRLTELPDGLLSATTQLVNL